MNINTPETYERLFGSPPKLAPPPKRRVGGKKGASTGSDMHASPAMMAAPEE